MRAQEESVFLLHDGGTLEPRPDLLLTSAYSKSPNWSRWVTLILALFIIADMGVWIHIVRLLSGHDGRRSSDLSDLPFRNPYVGLDTLYRTPITNTSRYGPIINLPRIATQVDEANPHKVYPEDEHRMFTSSGMVTPPEHRFHVSKNIHTIMQFRVVDFGMERCALTLRLPRLNATLSDPFVLQSNAEEVNLKICALDASKPLDRPRLSWARRPRCLEYAGAWVAKPDTEVRLPDFHAVGAHCTPTRFHVGPVHRTVKLMCGLPMKAHGAYSCINFKLSE